MSTNLAPIVLFVYNRPWHTLQTLESLKNNELASESELYVYCDGPKENASEQDLIKIKETRDVIKKNQWCGKVNIIERNDNKGLAYSIIDGVTDVVSRYGKIIVLEDDIVTSIGFLRYLNDALWFYENESKVMHISAYMFPLNLKLPETFFYNSATCWGWATWKRSWNHLNINANDLYEKLIIRGELDNFDYKESFGFIKQLNDNMEGKIKTWAIKWHTTIYLLDGFCLHPNISLINNIGHDSTGENCIPTSIYSWNNLAKKINVNVIPIKESYEAKNGMIKFNAIFRRSYKNSLMNFFKRIRNKLGFNKYTIYEFKK